MSKPSSSPLPVNVLPLDALRFLSALWVCLYHGVKPPGNRILPYFDLAWDAFLFGGTGVLAFFVISGFCIHYPAAARGKEPPWGSFLTRRFVRVLIPYFAVLPFAYWTGRNYNMITGNDLTWTILCDLCYYAMYPFLYFAARRTGWNVLLAISFLLSAAGLALNLNDRVDVGNFILVPIFLPIWVLGCVVAEKFTTRHRTTGLQVPSARSIFSIRAAILVCTPIMAVLTFYRYVPSWIYLGVPLGLLVTAWLWMEICYFSTGRAIPSFLAWAGTWIYSLYLTHPITQRGIDLFLQGNFPGVDSFLHSHFVWLSLRFVLMLAATFGAAYVFARLVEFPSHELARRLSRLIKY